MRPIKLDFISAKPVSTRSGIVLLIFALGISAKIYGDYSHLASEAESMEAKVARLEKLAGRKTVSERQDGKQGSQASQEIARANEVVKRLSMPWDALFNAIETSSKGQVALLSILPDEKNGTVNISGEAKNPAAMLEYVRLLGREKSLSHVHLLNHQVEEMDPQKPVRFSLVASWLR